MKKIGRYIILAFLTAPSLVLASGRDVINIVGSSTVYPFATVVAERFGKSSKFKTPKIESTGTGGGIKLFCAGVDINTPDITNASRRMKQSEFNLCQKNGVKKIVEVLVGYDGIVLANTKLKPQMQLSLRDIFLALAKSVPATDGSETLIDNPYKTWQDVNPNLPANKIEVLGPPPTSYIEAGENDNLIVQKLVANPNAMGVFGFSFLDQNSDIIQGSIINLATAEFESIADGDYPISRPLYFYVKKAHIGVIPGIAEYITAFTSEAAYGEDGYLTDKGLIPLDDAKRQMMRQNANDLQNLDL